MEINRTAEVRVDKIRADKISKGLTSKAGRDSKVDRANNSAEQVNKTVAVKTRVDKVDKTSKGPASKAGSSNGQIRTADKISKNRIRIRIINYKSLQVFWQCIST